METAKHFVNIRYSLRNLSDEKFEEIIDRLALEISQMDIEIHYDDKKLLNDWKNLVDWKTEEWNIHSTQRIGMKLCEHFFPNFYDIKNKKGDSFRNLWTQENLIKILRWNRKSHSTPYLSELKRGIYFCCGLTKNTMYRPQMAKIICSKYNPNVVLDPCAGWGGRLLGVVASGAKYIAFEPNTKTYENLMRLCKFLNIQDRVQIICDDARNIKKYNLPKVDLILTSPPYFDLEVYCDEKTQSIHLIDNYEKWSETFLKSIIDQSIELLNEGGVSCWNVAKVGKNDMNDDVEKYHDLNNFSKLDTFSVISSKRQALQKTNKDKSYDITISYKK